MAGQQRFRYDRVRLADKTDDQKSAAQILGALGASVTQEDLQEFVLSQIKRIIFESEPGNWYSDFSSLGIKSLKQLGEDYLSEVWGVALVGPKNGVNQTFTTPNKFVNLAGGRTIRVFYNGVRQTEIDDYTLSESGGSGTGYDTVFLLTPKRARLGDALTADYIKIP